MKTIFAITIAALISSMNFAVAADHTSSANAAQNRVTYTEGTDIEAFWKEYAKSKGGLTWGESSTYPEYDRVKEGDTILIHVAQGPCLMEFFHSRWRRANDVWRWSEAVNEYGGCPYVFD